VQRLCHVCGKYCRLHLRWNIPNVDTLTLPGSKVRVGLNHPSIRVPRPVADNPTWYRWSLDLDSHRPALNGG